VGHAVSGERSFLELFTLTFVRVGTRWRLLNAVLSGLS
jgi:hypothetical protein